MDKNKKTLTRVLLSVMFVGVTLGLAVALLFAGSVGALANEIKYFWFKYEGKYYVIQAHSVDEIDGDDGVEIPAPGGEVTPTATVTPSTPTPAPTPQPTQPPVAGNGQVTQYDQLPGAVKSNIAVNVNGQNVFVEKFKDISYARFAVNGAAKITVTSPNAASYTVSPRSYNIQPVKSGNTMTFSINQPTKLIVHNGTEKLFILADAPETDAPKLGAANVIDVSKYANPTSGVAQTAQIQKALDEASAKNGIAYFPKGNYVAGTLRVKSNSSVYLSSGALISGTGRVADYDEGHFILFEGSTNAKLYGRGVIDLRGKQMRTASGDAGRIKIIRSINASNITVNDILLRDAGSWTVHFIGSTNVNVKNLKLMNDQTISNGDGIDPDSSSNVTIDSAFLYTTDDCFAIKTSGTFKVLKPSNNIVIKNSICHTKKSALKVGTETRANLSNITFENNHVVHADRIMSLYMADGKVMENIKYINNTSEQVGGDSKQRLFDISITNRGGIGYIRNVEITNYTAYQQSPKASAIAGASGHVIDLKFKNLVIAGQQQTSAAGAKITVKNANVTFTK